MSDDTEKTIKALNERGFKQSLPSIPEEPRQPYRLDPEAYNYLPPYPEGILSELERFGFRPEHLLDQE